MVNERNITINGHTLTISTKDDPFGVEDTIKLDLPLTRMDVVAIGRVIEKFDLVPGQEITSHKNFYFMLKALKSFDIDYEDSLTSWQDHKQWRHLSDPEFVPLVCVIDPTTTSFRTASNIFGDNILDILQKAMYLIEDITDTDIIIDFHKLFNEIEFFDEDTQEKYTKLKVNYHDRLMLRPHTDTFAKYFRYTTPSKITYSATGVSRYPAFIADDPTIADAATFAERWTEVSCGMFDKSPNDSFKGEFPFETCVIAGGCLARTLNYHFKNANNFDIDIFVIGKDRNDRVNNMRKVISWFESPNTYFSIIGSVVTVYIIGCPRMFQIISNDKTTAYDVISSFDSAHLQWAFVNGTVFGTAAAFDSYRHMTTTPTNVGRFRGERFVKAMYDGFNVVYEATHEDNLVFDLSHLVADPENNQALKNIIGEFYRYWYPRDDPTLTGAERDMYIKEEIKLHTKCNVVATALEDVLKHVTVGGNFETDYAATTYQSFNFSNVKVRASRRAAFDVQDHNGIVRLVSVIMTIDEIKNGANDFRITCNVTPNSEFEDFLKSIDGLLYRMFILRRPKTLTLNDGKVSFHLTPDLIERQTANEISILKNQHGDPLDITTQLEAGEQVRILFKIHVILGHAYGAVTEPGLHLFTSRITKYDASLTGEESEDDGNNSDVDLSDSDDE